MNLPEEILKQHIAVLGKTGSGKTSTEKLIVEHVFAQDFRVCVLDTTKSDWWGITSSASGKSAGLPFKILGGPKGHVPLHANAGKVIGQIVGEGKLPHCIIDMADFEAGGIQKFFVDFAPALMRSARGVLYLVIEEAHELAPKERAGFGQENMAIHWAKKMATAGRSKGIRLIVATQRVQALHNAVLGSCETIITHRLTTPADQEPVVKWLRANTSKENAAIVAGEMSSLPTGTAWVCSGEAKYFKSVAFPKFKTYDNTSTPTGDSEAVEIKTAHVDQDELKAIIGSAVDEAKANDPLELKKEISRLKKQLAEQPVAAKALPPATVEVSVLKDDDRDLLKRFSKEVNDAAEQSEKLFHETQGLRTIMEQMVKRITGIPSQAKAVMPTGTRFIIPQPKRVVPPIAQRSIRPENGESIGGGMKRMMIAIAQRPGITKKQIGVRAGLSSSSGTFGTYIAKLRTNGWVADHGNSFQLTTDGASALGAYLPLPEGRDLYEYWRGELGGGAGRMLEALYSAECPISKEELGVRAGISHTSGTFGTYLAKLRTLELVTGKHELSATEEFFE